MTETAYTEPPKLESAFARYGIIGIAVVSAIVYWKFWAERGDYPSAWLTVGAQAVALGGFAMMLHHGRSLLGYGAALVTAIAALWCGLTMFEKLNTEAQARALEAVQNSSAYLAAADDLDFARQQLRIVQQQRPPSVDDANAGRLAAWGENRRQELSSLTAERDRMQARVDALIPPPGLDVIALLRGLGIQLAELIGLAVFGFGVGNAGRRVERSHSQTLTPPPAEPAKVVTMRDAAAALGKRSGEARRNRARGG